jgi:diadenosine tetraphosphate (Ap4A) HIT family hydrolase
MEMTDAVNQHTSKSLGIANAHFVIKPCVRCPVAGYLIVSPRLPVNSLSQLQPDALSSLGPTLALATRAIEVVICPDRVYCALFAEESRSVHFHLFPRSQWLLSQYPGAHRADQPISGPRLLDWARRTFHSPIPDDYGHKMEAIFAEIERNI